MDEKEGLKDRKIKCSSISSADGWNHLLLTFARSFTVEDRKLILTALTHKGKYWDRERSLRAGFAAELTDDYNVVLPQVVLSRNKLEELVERLNAWLLEFSSFEIDLSGHSDQSISVFIGQRDDLISRPDRPVFSLTYSTSRMKGQWSFVTDPSCISAMLQDLSEYLASAVANQ